jgi:death-on-curing protein
MRYLSLGEIVDLHQALLDQTGGAAGVRDLGGLESALAQPRATFDGTELMISPAAVGCKPS